MLRTFTLVFCLLLSNFLLWGQSAGKLSTRLQADLVIATPSDQFAISILLADRVDIRSMDQQFYAQRTSLNQRTKEVVAALKLKANTTQASLINFLMNSDGVAAQSIQSFWVTNVVFCTATADVIQQLGVRQDVDVVDLNVRLLLDDYEVVPITGAQKSIGGHEPGHDAIKAPTMWAMGYSGYGRKVMSLDTGVDPFHSAISDHFDGNYHSLQQSWFVLNRPPELPEDCNGHGTHTVGIMCGLDTINNDTIGVAWGARWIGSPSLCGDGSSTDRNIAAFQFAMDPDNNPATIGDMPDVINNSWRDPNTVNECSGLYKSTFDAVEAVGIAIVFSAGNSGPLPSTITQPKNINTDLVNVFCVANVNGNVAGFPIAGSSSSGPSTCGGTGSLNIKPEVAAPGSNVRSSYQGDFSLLSGTSMAAPHVAGAIALLKEPFPYLTGTEIKLALYNSCVDLGVPGEDNTYGMGIIDVPAAFNYIQSQGNLPVTPPVNDAAIVNVLGINAYNCDTTPQLSFVLENRGTDNLTSCSFLYSIDQGDTLTFAWNGNLDPLATEIVSIPSFSITPGSHELIAVVILPNGIADERTFNDQIRRLLEIPQFASADAGHVCESGSATLTAVTPASGEVQWFAQPNASPAIGLGPTYNTPVISTTTFYYADVTDTNFVGKSDTTGSGEFQVSPSRYLVFDCFNPFTLVSVKVFSDVAGPRRVELRADNGAILDSVTVMIPVGESRVMLNFNILPGSDYRLGIGTIANLFRNSESVLYPYTIPGVVSIKTSSAGSDFFYYYYDWEVAYWSPCGRTKVPVYVNQPIAVNMTYSPTTYKLTEGVAASFQDNTTGAASWLWDFGDGAMDDQQNTSHTYTGFARPYTVELVVADTSNACKDSLTITYDVISGAEEIAFPNPSAGNFKIDLGLGRSDELTVSLYDLSGKQLIDGWVAQASSTFLDVDLTTLADGTYIIVIQVMDRKITERLVKTSN
ncbi:MAG: S8 family serine peptidase [Flavobacteriales bacterium]|nr:S8 family serine peptidase [Flavobacteriales bacterium]